MTIKICVAATAENMPDLRSMIVKAKEAKADLIEIRMDYFKEELDLRAIRRATTLPLIATNRRYNEGGLFKGPEEERVSLLLEAATSGFDLVDIECMVKDSESVVRSLKAFGARVIASHHILHTTPSLSEINKIFRKEIETGCDICKIITMAKKIEDNLTCLKFLAEASKTKEVICFCMGELGRVSRLLSPLYGGYFTYAAFGRGKESASGQLTLAETRKIYELLGIHT